MSTPIITICGRPNVGKSTLFNRLIERKEAIVDEVSGVTRDRHYGKSDWNGVEFSVIDTGGYLPASDDVFQKEIDKQVILAIDEADVILFLVDVKDGLTGVDQSIADLLHKSSKETLLLVNKVDNSKLIDDSNEFYSLGFISTTLTIDSDGANANAPPLDTEDSLVSSIFPANLSGLIFLGFFIKPLAAPPRILPNINLRCYTLISLLMMKDYHHQQEKT